MVRSELKTKAKKAISGKIGNIFLVMLVMFAVFLVISLVLNFVAGLIFGSTNSTNQGAAMTGSIVAMVLYWVALIFIAGGFMLSCAAIFLNVASKKPEVSDLKFGFEGDNKKRGVFGYIRYMIFTSLWSLLFVVPGIIKQFAYSQMFYLMADDKKLTAAEAQKKSIAMMDGHKGEYFVLQLSFIPWVLLTSITFGLAGIYVLPYMSATYAEFYKGLKKAAK